MSLEKFFVITNEFRIDIIAFNCYVFLFSLFILKNIYIDSI